MKAIQEKIGDVQILIQAIDEEIEVLGEAQNKRDTRTTGTGDKLKKTYDKLQSVLKTLAEEVGSHLKNIESSSRPKQVEAEFKLGLSAQFGPVWLLSGKGDYSIKVKMTWELFTHDKSDN